MQVGEQISLFDLDTWSGKMSPEPSVATKERTSEPSLKKRQKSQIKMPLYLNLRRENGVLPAASWEMGGALLGEYTMHSFGECPSEERESRLSQILQGGALPKYYLSVKACQGILRRAEKRGKELPPMLQKALERQAGLSTMSESVVTEQKTGEHTPTKPTDAETLTRGGAVMDTSENVTGSLRAQEHGHQPAVVQQIEEFIDAVNQDAKHQQDLIQSDLGVARTIAPGTHASGPHLTKTLVTGIYDARGNGDGATSPTITGDHENRVTDYTAVCIGNGQTAQTRISDKVGALNCMHDQQAVMQGISGDVAGTLDASYYKGCGERQGVEREVVAASVVRRLTPLECERLQGYPCIREVKFTEMTKDEYIAWNICEGHILVDTENGKVYRTRGQRGTMLEEPKEMSGTDVNGYLVVSIRNGNTKMMCRIHRIIWIAAHGIIPDGYVIDHINNNKKDNRLANLQMLTPGENSTKARNEGLYKIHEEAGQAKISDETHDYIQYIYESTDSTIKELAKTFGISKSRVHQIIHEHGWTDIGEWVDSKGKTHKDADSPRYKALGNSIALPFWEWMAKRMAKYLPEGATMASLFSGIGGFELVFSRAGCKPIWASEVEEFAIAVTKRRFPDEDSTDVRHIVGSRHPHREKALPDNGEAKEGRGIQRGF